MEITKETVQALKDFREKLPRNLIPFAYADNKCYCVVGAMINDIGQPYEEVHKMYGSVRMILRGNYDDGFSSYIQSVRTKFGLSEKELVILQNANDCSADDERYQRVYDQLTSIIHKHEAVLLGAKDSVF